MWIWAQVVQTRLDKYVLRDQLAQVRKQKNTHLPSGGSHNDFYDFPEEYACGTFLFLWWSSIDRLIEEHQPPRISSHLDEGEAVAQSFTHICMKPQLSVLNVWKYLVICLYYFR